MVDFRLSPGWLPAGVRVYAIGDVHGCADRLRVLHREIAADLASRPVAAPVLVHLGDYVDRGPDSAAVIRLLDAGPHLPVSRIVNLAGNHEAMMREALTGDREAARQWLCNGGDASLVSWGMDPDSHPAGWAARLPAPDRAFLARLTLWHREGSYFFVHAGVRPGKPLERQTEEDMLWIREPFLSHRGALGAIIVHGHTPGALPVVQENRIGIDTGAVLGGMLTAAVLEENRLGFIVS